MVNETYTIREAMDDNQRIYFAVGQHFGTQDILLWPIPFRQKKAMMDRDDSARERNIMRAMKVMGFKASLFGGIAQTQRTEFWQHIDKFYDVGMADDLKRGVLWCAWCRMIGIPTPDDIETIGETMFTTAVRGMEPKVWHILTPLSFYTGILFCSDYADLAEFLIWFTGMEIEIGWMKYPEFTEPLKAALDKQRPYFAEVAHYLNDMVISPDNVEAVSEEIIDRWGEYIELEPIIFDFDLPGNAPQTN